MHETLKDESGKVLFVPYQEGPLYRTHDGKRYKRMDVPARNPDGTRADFSYYTLEPQNV